MQVIFPDQMRKGFTSVVDSLDDLRLDVPDAVELAALFICRLVEISSHACVQL